MSPLAKKAYLCKLEIKAARSEEEVEFARVYCNRNAKEIKIMRARR